MDMYGKIQLRIWMTTFSQVNKWNILGIWVAIPDSILRALFLLCNKCIGVETSPSCSITLLQVVNISNYPESDVTSQVVDLVNAIVGFIFKPGQCTIVQCGSTAVGLKICDWGEFDFQLQLPVDVNTAEFTLNKGSGGTELHYKGTNEIYKNGREYLHDRLEHLLSALRNTDEPHTGVPYTEGCYPHSRPPGVFVELIWWCLHDHKHRVYIDLTPAIVLKDRKLSSIWHPPEFFKQGKLGELCKELGDMNPVFVMGEFVRLNSKSNTAWIHTFNTCDSAIHRYMSEISPHIKDIMRSLKYIRDSFFPKVWKPTPPIDTDLYQCDQGELVSSYILQQCVWYEVILHPESGDWGKDKLLERMISILTHLRRPEIPSFYTGRAEAVMCVAPVDRARMESWLHRDIDMVVACIRATHSDSNTARMTVQSPDQSDKHQQPTVTNTVTVYLIPKTGDTLVKFNTNEVLMDSAMFRRNLAHGQSEPMHFYYELDITPFAVSLPLLHEIISQQQMLLVRHRESTADDLDDKEDRFRQLGGRFR